MDLVQIYHKANILIAQTYGITGVPETLKSKLRAWYCPQLSLSLRR